MLEDSRILFNCWPWNGFMGLFYDCPLHYTDIFPKLCGTHPMTENKRMTTAKTKGKVK